MPSDDEYTTLTGDRISLHELTTNERVYLAGLFQKQTEGMHAFEFHSFFLSETSPVRQQAQRLGVKIEECPLFKVCDDIEKRLGIQQGYMDAAAVVQKERLPDAPELTLAQVATLAGCGASDVKDAIRNGELRSRWDGSQSVVWERDAGAFAAYCRCRESVSKLIDPWVVPIPDLNLLLASVPAIATRGPRQETTRMIVLSDALMIGDATATVTLTTHGKGKLRLDLLFLEKACDKTAGPVKGVSVAIGGKTRKSNAAGHAYFDLSPKLKERDIVIAFKEHSLRTQLVFK